MNGTNSAKPTKEVLAVCLTLTWYLLGVIFAFSLSAAVANACASSISQQETDNALSDAYTLLDGGEVAPYVCDPSSYAWVNMVWFLWACGLIAFTIWAALCIRDAANNKGLNGSAFLVAALFFPLITLIVLVVSTPKSVALQSNGGMSQLQGEIYAKCPQCAESIKLEAKICRFCGSKVDSEFAKLRATYGNES